MISGLVLNRTATPTHKTAPWLRSLARQFVLAGLFYLSLKLAPATRPSGFSNLWPWRVAHGLGHRIRGLGFTGRGSWPFFSWQGPPAIGSICAVFAPDSADFAPRPALAGTGACAMFLTNNHKENSMSNIKSHRVPR